MNINKQEIQFANQNGSIISDAILHSIAHERQCWSMLGQASQYINFAHADIIEVMGQGIGAHIAMLARQFPTLNFTFGENNANNDASRILWVSCSQSLNQAKIAAQNCEAIIVCHKAEEARIVINAFEDFARIGAKRDIGNGHALSIFGRGLSRDLFKPKVRGALAA